MEEAIFTPRQLEILRLVEQGLKYKQIAIQLFISPKTVGAHMLKMCSMVGAHNRRQLLYFYRNRGQRHLPVDMRNWTAFEEKTPVQADNYLVWYDGTAEPVLMRLEANDWPFAATYWARILPPNKLGI